MRMNVAQYHTVSPICHRYDEKAILARTNIIQVARELGMKVGRSVIPCVRRHRHKNPDGFPTMSINPANNSFRCWVCNDVKGNVVDLVRIVKNVTNEQALEFLAIRAGVVPSNGNGGNGNGNSNGGFHDSAEELDKETIYKQFFDGHETSSAVELMAFASLKGGTGKSLIVNNLAATYSLLMRFIADHEQKDIQHIDLIDLDFGKPDQRILTGVEPNFYLEDLLYKREKNLRWEDLRVNTRIANLGLVSSAPIRRSWNMFYLHKNEIVYLIHESSAKLKLADFGGGLSKDILDFLGNIKSKICVINGEETSKEAIFYLLLSILYDQLKKDFGKTREIEPLLEKFRDCVRTGFTAGDLTEELGKLDKKKQSPENLEQFYYEAIVPLKRMLCVPLTIPDFHTWEDLEREIDNVQEQVQNFMFQQENSIGEAISHQKKVQIYKQFNLVKEDVKEFQSYRGQFERILKRSLFGLIINKTDAARAWEIQGEVISRVSKYLNQTMVYLGNLREDKVLQNISNYKMPFVIFNPEEDVLQELFTIADNLIGLKDGSIRTVIASQKEYIRELKRQWLKN